MTSTFFLLLHCRVFMVPITANPRRVHADMFVWPVQQAGQVYIPIMNYLLMALCLIIVGAFQTSTNIGKAYGRNLFGALADNSPFCFAWLNI